MMDLDDSGFLTLRELARGVPTITQVSSYLISPLHSNNWKISLSHFEVMDPDGICCQPDIFTGCQICPAPNCPFSYLGAEMFVCFLSCHIVQVPNCPTISHCTVNPVTSVCSHAVVKDLRLRISGSWSMFIKCLEL